MQKHSIGRVTFAWALSVLFVGVGLCGVGLFGACSDKTEGLRACPTDSTGKEVGIGVIDFQGVKASAQIVDAFLYNCSKPQICPDQGAPFMPYFVVDPSVAPFGVNLGLTNCSTGNSKLVIEKIVVVGDARCSFTDASVESKDIAPGKGNTTYVKVDWFPKSAGDDHAAMWIYSNAQNFNPLKIPFCGRAVAKTGDAGIAPTPDSGTYTEAGTSVWQCKEVSTVNTGCPHQE